MLHVHDVAINFNCDYRKLKNNEYFRAGCSLAIESWPLKTMTEQVTNICLFRLQFSRMRLTRFNINQLSLRLVTFTLVANKLMIRNLTASSSVATLGSFEQRSKI